MIIDKKIKGWRSIKKKLIEIIRTVNKHENLQIKRSGTQDAIIKSSNSLLINIAEFPKAISKSVGAADSTNPLKLVQIDATTIAFHYGTVDNFVPKIGSTALSTDHTQNTITVSTSKTYYLKVTIDANGNITNVEIVDADPGTVSETMAKQIIGSVTFSSGAITNVAANLTGSQNLDSCGAIHSWNVI
jgi:hypothetical protein